MSDHKYRFISRWRVPGSTEQVAGVFFDPLQMAGWWPSVVCSADPVIDDLGHSVYRMVTKGWMPYTVHWQQPLNTHHLVWQYKLIG